MNWLLPTWFSLCFSLKLRIFGLRSDIRGYLKNLNQQIPKAYVDHLKTLGVEAGYLKDWEKLIALRYEEYARDRHEVRAAAMQLESTGKTP